MNFRRAIAPLVMVVMLCCSWGCVKQPTSSQKMVDDRPAITLKSQSGSVRVGDELYVDNLPVGDAWRYQAGRSALRVLSGSHIIAVKRNGDTIYEETIYLGDGAVKEIIIP